MFWNETRHELHGRRKPPSTDPADQRIEWRSRDRVRTAIALLVVCLRIGYDPPDVIKTDPCAKLECWVDPYSLPKDKAMERIGANLQSQFESLAAMPKTKYKQYLDPPIEDAKRFCTAARRNAKHERVLYYYNGHGVPKPTSSGELWLFNRQYTQYIPVSLADIIAWLGSPTIYVWDCSNAGNIVSKVQEFSARRDDELAQEATAAAAANNSGASSPQQPKEKKEQMPDPRPHIPFRETIQLAACGPKETLPMNPDLPADLFTSCLTSPIEIGLRFFLLRNPLQSNLSLDQLLKIPGKLNDRRTPLGELMWVFTAITDTIAWNTIPRDLFQKLFRHDLVVAALFRGFLLAERVMRFYDCTPISVPALPQTHNHPLWDSWDLAVDMCLSQLPAMLAHEERYSPDQQQIARQPGAPAPPPPQPDAGIPPPLPYQHTTFFSEQLTAFEIWLDQGNVVRNRHPQHLPVVLQVLLSQVHRLRALILLCKFLDLGPWAVNIALSIGIFAYVLRLLQAPAAELKPVLIYIWARILAVYDNCKEDLLKQAYPATRTGDFAPYMYFVNVLAPSPNAIPIPNVSEHRAMCAFILSVCCRDHRPGQVACLRANVFDACMVHLRDPDALLRQWAALCIAQLWDDFDEAKGLGIRMRAHELLCSILHTDEVPEVRAAVLYALGTLLGTTGSGDKAKRHGRSIASSGAGAGLSAVEQTDVELGIAMSTLKCSVDGSPMVRRELVILLSSIVNEHQGGFVVAAYKAMSERQSSSWFSADLQEAVEKDEGPSNPVFLATMFSCIFRCLVGLASDPFPDVADLAGQVLDFVNTLLFDSPLAAVVYDTFESTSIDRKVPPPPPGKHLDTTVARRPEPPRQGGSVSSVSTQHHGSYGFDTLKKTASIASAMSKLAGLASGGTPQQSQQSPATTPPSSGSSAPRTNGPTPQTLTPMRADIKVSASTESLRYLQSRSGGRVPRRPTPIEDPALIERICSGLVAEDEERIRKKRAQANGSQPMQPSQSQEGAKVTLPLKSEYYEFNLDYFLESQMSNVDPEEPGSLAYNERLWRRNRNERLIDKTLALTEPAASARWDEQVGYCNVGAPISRLVFHEFEPHLVAANDQGELYVYDWEREHRVVQHFANGSPASVPITSLTFVNEADVATLLTGSADGHVRLFRHYDDPKEIKMVSSFRGLTDMVRSTRQEAGLVVEWQQRRGHLLMGGNAKYIRVWDALRELAVQVRVISFFRRAPSQLTMDVQDLPTHSNSCLTSLTSDQASGNIVAAGFGDGAVRVYDRRLAPRDNVVRTYKGYHAAWVQGVHLQVGGNRELASGSLAGEVCLWDIRLAEPVRYVQTKQADMCALALHDYAPVFATYVPHPSALVFVAHALCSGSQHGYVKVWSVEQPEPISTFRSNRASLSASVRGVARS